MKGTIVEWLLLIALISASLAIAATGNPDASLLVAAFAMTLYAFISKNSKILLNKNIVLSFAILLLLPLLAYRLMFDLVEVQLYIVNDIEAREMTIFYGAWLVQLLLIGGIVGILTARNFSQVNYPLCRMRASFKYLLIVAWIPLIANLFLYLLFFKGRSYVDIHTMGHGAIGLILKTIYLSYGAIILMAAGSYSEDKAFRAMKWLFFGFFVIYGLMLNLRSPLLLFILLFVYFSGNRLSAKTLALLMLVFILMFSAIGLIRDSTNIQDGILISLVAPAFGLGEFIDTLRFAMEGVKITPPLWGVGIAGSFFGVTEPMANSYTRMISQDYFDEGGGFGFYILADLVINFGLIGASIVIFILGFVLARQYYSGNYLSAHVIIPVLFSNLFALIRNDLGSTLRGVLYIAFSVLLILWFWRLIKLVKIS